MIHQIGPPQALGFHNHKANSKEINTPPIQHNFSPQIRNINPYFNQHPSKIIKSFYIDFSHKVGEGNYSTVYPVFDSQFPTSPPLVVKIIDMQRMKKQNLYHIVSNQIQIMQKTHHDNIIGCRDIILQQNWCYIIMDFCEGGTLQSYIKASNCCITENYDSIRIIKQILDGLIYLQQKNIIHRDIKAANILFKDNRPIIADFGFARYLESSKPVQDLNLGSLPYMTPEALALRIFNLKTDVWAFGILIYEIFHGESPFAKSHNIPQLKEKVHTPLQINSKLFRNDLSLPLRQLIINCLTIDYEKRPSFKDIRQMACFRQLCNMHFYSQKYIFNNHEKIQTPKNKIDQSQEKMLQSNSDFETPIKNSTHRDKPNGQNIFSENNANNCRQQDKLKMNHKESQTIRKEKNRQTNSASPFNKISFGKALRTHHLASKNSNDVNSRTGQNSPVPNPNLSHKNSKGAQYLKDEIKEAKSMKSEKKQKFHTFKQILLQIQESRDYYKLAINLKNSYKKQGSREVISNSRNQKVSKIKQRMILRAYQKICDIEGLIQLGKVNYGISPSQNRKQKVLSVVNDYKVEFRKQIQKRDLQNRIIKLQLIAQNKTPSFIKLSSAKHLNIGQISQEQYQQSYNRLLEQDLKTIERLELQSNEKNIRVQKNNTMNTQILSYQKKIKGFIDDLRELKNNKQFHRQY